MSKIEWTGETMTGGVYQVDAEEIVQWIVGGRLARRTAHLVPIATLHTDRKTASPGVSAEYRAIADEATAALVRSSLNVDEAEQLRRRFEAQR